MLPIHNIRYLMGVQQCPHQGGRRVESSVHHERRPIWTNGYVFWTHQLPSHIPDDDELNICQRDSREMVNSLHG
jgi:hypothetical protein